ncbi:MAG: hypothetical protein CMF50_00815 [Legionellales bacterium]|nr:hypothetical protein [Legionellales bacterium]|tara:strand:- start:43712 stop:45097 length:1386 start_codon:yes stop_codon:yes gene_type:complete
MYSPENLITGIVSGQDDALSSFRAHRRNSNQYFDNQRLIECLCQHEDWSFLHPLFLISEVRDAIQYRPGYIQEIFYHRIAWAFQAKNLGAVCLLILDRSLLAQLVGADLINVRIFDDVYKASDAEDELAQSMLDTIRGILHTDGFSSPNGEMTVSKDKLIANNYLTFAKSKVAPALYYQLDRQIKKPAVEPLAKLQGISRQFRLHCRILDGRCFYRLAQCESSIMAISQDRSSQSFEMMSQTRYFEFLVEAANLQYADAQWHLAQLYLQYGLEEDAMTYFRAAAEQNHEPAKQKLGELTPDESVLSSDERLSREIERIRFFFHPEHRDPKKLAKEQSQQSGEPLELGSDKAQALFGDSLVVNASQDDETSTASTEPLEPLEPLESWQKCDDEFPPLPSRGSSVSTTPLLRTEERGRMLGSSNASTIVLTPTCGSGDSFWDSTETERNTSWRPRPGAFCSFE